MVELRCLGEMRAWARERVGVHVSGALGSEVDRCADLWLGRERIRAKPEAGCARLPLPLTQSTGSSLRSCVPWTRGRASSDPKIPCRFPNPPSHDLLVSSGL